MLAELVKTMVIAISGDLKAEAISDVKSSILNQAQKAKIEKDLNLVIEAILAGEQNNPHFNMLSKMIYERTVFDDYISRRLNGGNTLDIKERVEEWAKLHKCTEDRTQYLRSVATRLSSEIDECLRSNLSGETKLQNSFLQDEIMKSKEEIINVIEDNKNVIYNVNNVNKTFVTSNLECSDNRIEKCSINLSIGLYEDEICLSPESIQTLKDYSRLDKTEKKNGIEVSIDIVDFDRMALYIRNAMGGSEDNSYGIDIVRQKLSTRIKGIRKSIEYSVRCMLEYSESSLPESYNDIFIEKYGLDNFTYLDEFNVECYYSEVYYWVTISNLIIKKQITDFIVGTSTVRDNYFKVDFFIRSLSWSFSTFIPEKYIKLESLSYRDATISDISNKDLLLYVYPNMYFSVGRMLDDKDGIPSESLKKYVHRLVNPLNYYIGIG